MQFLTHGTRPQCEATVTPQSVSLKAGQEALHWPHAHATFEHETKCSVYCNRHVLRHVARQRCSQGQHAMHDSVRSSSTALLIYATLPGLTACIRWARAAGTRSWQFCTVCP